MEKVPCGNPEEHDSHEHRVRMSFKCSGGTSCGMRVHPEHEWSENITVYCSGLCACQFKWTGKMHEQGEHK